MKKSMQRNLKFKTIRKGFNDFIVYKKSNNLSKASIEDYLMMFSIFADFYGD